MSTNLILGAGIPGKRREEAFVRCSLFQTPTNITRTVLQWPSRHEQFLVYMRWVEDAMSLSHGALLDHKVEVLMFMSQFPEAAFFAE